MAQVLAILALIAIALGVLKLIYPGQGTGKAVEQAASDASGCLWEGCMEVILLPLFLFLFVVVPAIWIGAIALIGFLIGLAFGIIKL